MSPEAQAALITASGLIILEAGKSLYKRYTDKPKPDLNDPDYTDILGHIVEDIQKELGAHRVSYWAAQNGESTLDGYSIKKLSMVAESNANGVDNMIKEMQNVPTVAFKRNIEALRSCNQYIHSHESEIDDDLGKANTAYGVNTGYFFKITNLKKKMWTGILVVAFEERKFELAPPQLGWLTLNAFKIESIISKL